MGFKEDFTDIFKEQIKTSKKMKITDEYLSHLLSVEPLINTINIAEDLYNGLKMRYLEKLIENMEQKREQENETHK